VTAEFSFIGECTIYARKQSWPNLRYSGQDKTMHSTSVRNKRHGESEGEGEDSQ
jgi:hypothetical protein